MHVNALNSQHKGGDANENEALRSRGVRRRWRAKQAWATAEAMMWTELTSYLSPRGAKGSLQLQTSSEKADGATKACGRR